MTECRGNKERSLGTLFLRDFTGLQNLLPSILSLRNFDIDQEKTSATRRNGRKITSRICLLTKMTIFNQDFSGALHLETGTSFQYVAQP